MRLHAVEKINMKSDKGSVLMESVICLPLLLLLSLGVAQYAHVWYCRTIVHYAAFCAARAAVTAPAGDAGTQARQAAETVCAPIAFSGSAGGRDMELPGIGAVPGSGALKVESQNILDVKVSEESRHYVMAEVEFGVPLLFPVAGPVIGQSMELFSGNSYSPGAGKGPGGAIRIAANNDFPRIVFTEKVFMPKPFLSTWQKP